jgi:hypothetical protein
VVPELVCEVSARTSQAPNVSISYPLRVHWTRHGHEVYTCEAYEVCEVTAETSKANLGTTQSHPHQQTHNIVKYLTDPVTDPSPNLPFLVPL